MVLIPIPAFDDNYIWMVHDGARALVVDPGDEQPVLQVLRDFGLRLETILVTHHHVDHVGGVDDLRQATGAAILAPAAEALPASAQGVSGGELVQALGLQFEVIDVPGHTAGHIAYFCADVDGAPLLFCGDTLFSGGCGRIFEGTPAQMLASLDRLGALPGATRVCAAHEYTLGNLRFARAVDPDNVALQRYSEVCEQKREQLQPTLPSTLATELAINPFLRSREPQVVRALQSRNPQARDEVALFAALREWKNQFR